MWARAAQAAAFYLGMLAYYWVLATPSVGFLFGAYLYVCVNWFHVHYDEAFSSLQAPTLTLPHTQHRARRPPRCPARAHVTAPPPAAQ